MRQKDVFNKIGVILKELNDQYTYLEANPDDMNSLELELFVANAHFLSDHAEILNKINLQLSTNRPALPPAKEEPKKEEPKKIEAKKEEPQKGELPKAEPKSEEKFFEPVVRQPAKKIASAVEKTEQPPAVNFDITPAADVEQPASQEAEIIRHELDIEEIADWDEEEAEFEDEPVEETAVKTELTAGDAEPKVTELVAEPAPEKPAPAQPAQPVEVPKDKDEVLTINQRMSAQLNKGGVADQPAATPVTDLKHAISLNDKLLYIKDLFNGYNLSYSEAIEILNRLGSFEDAERFLTKNYVTKNDWDSKADTAAKFYALLRRRYM